MFINRKMKLISKGYVMWRDDDFWYGHMTIAGFMLSDEITSQLHHQVNRGLSNTELRSICNTFECTVRTENIFIVLQYLVEKTTLLELKFQTI